MQEKIKYIVPFKECCFGYLIHFGDLSDWYIPISTGVTIHGTPVYTSVLERKKKRGKGMSGGGTK